MPQLPALLQRAQEPRAARDAGVRPRAAVQVSLLPLQQAPPQRAQEAHRQEAPQRAPGRARQGQVNVRDITPQCFISALLLLQNYLIFL